MISIIFDDLFTFADVPHTVDQFLGSPVATNHDVHHDDDSGDNYDVDDDSNDDGEVDEETYLVRQILFQ